MSLRRVLPSLLVLAVVAAGAGALLAPPASALSCIGPRLVLKDASVVYAGRVVDARDSRILVEVSEVWRGEAVAEQVWLRLDLESWFPWADRDGRVPNGFTTARDWVFAPEDGSVSPCSAWPVAEASRFRPADADVEEVTVAALVPGESGPAPDPGRPAWLLGGGGGLALLALLAAGWYAGLRRRQS